LLEILFPVIWKNLKESRFAFLKTIRLRMFYRDMNRSVNFLISKILRINVFFLHMQLFRHRYEVSVAFPCASFFPLWILSLFTSPFPLVPTQSSRLDVPEVP